MSARHKYTEHVSSVNSLKARLGNRLWRLQNLYRVRDERGVDVPFRPNEAQLEFYKNLWFLNVILKARQLGFSTAIAIYILDECVFRAGTAAGIIDATLDDAKAKLAKILFAYKALPESLRGEVRLVKENLEELVWSNGSSVKVGTSHRGGTLQILHVSEMGKIAAQFPEKSREIRTGAFGTVHAGQVIFVESTAEGQAGDFFDLVDEARKLDASGHPLSEMEFKFHFYPWWRDKRYVADPTHVAVPKEVREYVDKLEREHGVRLSREQVAWYTMKRKAVGPDDMLREYPSTPDEAFQGSTVGSYFRSQLLAARQAGRIGAVPCDPDRLVHTAWDLGVHDATCIWFFQSDGVRHWMVDYYESSDEGIAHYAKVLSTLAEERGYKYGSHYGPHDLGNREWLSDARPRVEVARDFGIQFTVVPKVSNKGDAIEAARGWLAKCWFDEERCARGLKCLEEYKREWDERLGTYKNRPLHNWASHGADAFLTAVCGHLPTDVRHTQDAYSSQRRKRRTAWT